MRRQHKQVEIFSHVEALTYLREKTGLKGSYHITNLNRLRRRGKLTPHAEDSDGFVISWTVESIEKLATTINNNPRPDTTAYDNYHRLYAANYRARKKGLPNTMTIEQWQHALNYFNGCCAACGRQLNDMFGEFKAGIDHWIPLTYKGDDNPGTVAANIVPLCHGDITSCNLSKSNAMPDEWLERKFGKRKANKILKRIQAYFDSLQ